MEEQAVRAAREAALEGRGHLDFLEELVAAEAARLSERSISRRIAAAHFPAPKTMAGWHWNWPTKINRMQLKKLLRLDFLEDHSNVILLGTAGLGKTHLVCALGNAACLQKHAVLFASAIDVVNRLSAAQSPHQLAREMKRYQTPRLLVLDELGYLPLDKRGGGTAVPSHKQTVRGGLDDHHHQHRLRGLAPDLRRGCDADLSVAGPAAAPCGNGCD
jgi:DNA replication protein DnaC